MFKGILLNKNEDGTTRAELTQIDEANLPADGDVTIAVEYSTINYKDGLAITGKSPVVRKWPMVPGIDGAGEVIASTHASWKVGDQVVLNGWGVGEAHMGCLAERAKLKGDWLIPLPKGMSTRTAMSIGTAGYTAMLCSMALAEQGVKPTDGEILVTGASGGVGSVAIAILAARGYKVIASTGKLAEADYLKSLGAVDVMDRAELSAPGKAMQKERWAGVVDSVGSHTLVNAVAQCRYGATVAACGLAQGMDFPATVAPFILRGVKLIGVDSVMVPIERRIAAWSNLALEIKPETLDKITHEITLAQALEWAPKILAGAVKGRLVVNVRA
jgi:acrylyl-CoA reductase (NADPH)